MAQDFKARITAELDTAQAEAKLQQFLNNKNKLQIDVELKQDSAKKLISDIEKGVKSTKLDTSSISKQLADSFHITDKSVINKIKSQLDSMISTLGKSWDGMDFNIADKGFQGFFSQMEPLQGMLRDHTKMLQGATGVYDDFFNYFKGKKIFISDDLKNALDTDQYKELLDNNIGKLVRDAKKGMDISSIWGEMQSLFPEHFPDHITNQADQLIHTFDLVKKAREDMAQVQPIAYKEMSKDMQQAVDDFSWKQASDSADMLMRNLKNNIQQASEISKTQIDLDVVVNTDRITDDIKNAIRNAANVEEEIQLNLKIDEAKIKAEIQSAMQTAGTGDTPLDLNITINREALKSELNTALLDVDLPVNIKVDADALADEIRAAVNNITDIEVNLHVNADAFGDEITNAANRDNIHVSMAQGNLAGYPQIMNRINTAAQNGNSVFQRFGSSIQDAFGAFTMANLLEDGIYKVVDTAKQGIETVKELNDIKMDLSMATGQDKAYISDLMKSYNSLGQELGGLTSDVAASADSWLRQGRTLTETNQLVTDSMILSKDTQMGAEQASKVLTATINGFQLNADQASHINDVLTSIDLESASDASGIGEALTRSATMANTAGVSLEKTAAIIATMKDVTQDSDASIGTSIKSILSRMNQIKAGKFVDAETGEALNDVETVLDKVGISMRDVNGQFMDSEPILDEVAGKWEAFDSNTKKAVATALAGTYQYNKLIAAFDNWDKVQALTDTALNSDGTAQKKFEENYLTSLEAKTNSLKASLENLASTVLSDGMYAGFLDGAKAMTDFIAKTDLLQAALAGLGTVGGGVALGWVRDMVTGFSDLSSALDMVGAGNLSSMEFDNLLNLTSGLSESQTRLVLSSEALTDAQRIAVLMNQGLSQAEAQSSVAAMRLAAAQGTAATATVTLSGALKGLWSTLLANPLILVAAGVTAAVSAISAYNHSVQEAVSSARESGNAWEENNASLEGHRAKIEELRSALSSGTLSEQEAAQAKSDLLSIQESLTESYGDQVQGIDLLNGSLEEQLALLDQVSKKEAERYRNENKKGIDKATKEMEKERQTYLGRFYDDGSKEAEAIKASVKKLQDTYGEEIIQLDKSTDGTMAVDIQFKADAATAKDALNDFMTDMDSIQKQYGATDLSNTLTNNASAGLDEAKEVLEEYQDIYKQAQKADLLSDTRLFKADGKEQTASKWLKDYAQAVEAYNKALADGDETALAQTAGQFEAMDKVMQSMSTGSMAEYSEQIQEIREQLNTSAVASDKFYKALSGKDASKAGKGIYKSVEALKALNLSDTDFRYAFETEGVQEGEEAIQSLVDAALNAGVISDTSTGQISVLAGMLSELGIIAGTSASGLDTAGEAVSGLTENMESASTALKSIHAATDLLTSQGTGQSITIDDFNSEELKDYTSALEYNNGALQLNADKVRELQQAKAEEAIQSNENSKLEKQSQYMENIAEIEELQGKLRGLSDAKSEQAETIQSSIDALLTENDSIVNQCTQLDLLSASLREATGAYQNWLDRENGSESGDMFDDTLGAMQHIDDVTQNTDSEFYGRIGRESYQAAVEFIIPESVDGENAEAVQSYMDSIEQYFTHDADGNRVGLDVAEFCQQAVDQGLMVIDEASGEYQVAAGKTMEQFAEGLNLSLPVVQAMFGEMEEFGGQFSWADEAVKTFGDLGMAAGEAKQRIEEVSGNTGMDIQIDVSDIETTEGKISALETTISQMQEYKGTVGLDASQIQDANTIIQYCLTQKQLLETPSVMSVDASQVDGEIGNAISLLQQFQQAQNTLELQAAVGADTSEAQGQVDGLVAQIQGLSPEIKASLGVDGASAASITASIQGLTPEIMVQAGVDSSVVDAWASQEKKSSGTVKWKNDTGTVDAWASQAHTSSGTVTWGNDISQVRTSFTASGTVRWTNTTPPSGGGHDVNGTAHAAGTAYAHLVGHAQASGNWGTKTGGVTLVGELGREIVVNPSSGTWYTVGDNGAEFVNIPKHSIVFNHLQSEALLERGFVAGRGKALASGTAMVSGGISINQANIASGTQRYSSSSSSSNRASSANTSATNRNTTATNRNTSAAKKNTQAYDWITRRLEYFANKTKDIADKITDWIQSSTKAKLLKEQISATNTEMWTNRSAGDAYLREANAVRIHSDAKKDAAYKKAIREGKYDIQDIDTSTDSGKKLYDNMSKYQKYYDEYVKCTQAVRDLRNEQVKLFAEWANMPTEEAEKKINTLTQSYNGLTAIQSRLETANMGGSAQAALKKELDRNMGYVTNNRNNANKRYNEAKDKYNQAKSNQTKAQKAADLDGFALKSKTSHLLSIKLTDDEKKRISNGQTLSTKGLSGKKKTLVQQYNDALKKRNASMSKYNSAKNAVTAAKNEFNSASSSKKHNDAMYNSYKQYYDNAIRGYDAGDPVSYQNALVDAELKNLDAQNFENIKAYRKTSENTQSAKDKLNSLKSQQTTLKKQGTDYSKKYAKYLTAEQKKQLQSGGTVSKLYNIKNDSVRKALEKYNNDLRKNAMYIPIAQEQLVAAQEAETQAAENAAKSQAEYAAAQVEAEQKKFENIQNYYNKRIEYQEKLAKQTEAQAELDKSHGEYDKSSNYDTQIKNLEEARKLQSESAKRLQEQLNKAVKSGVIKKDSDEWLEMQGNIVEAENAVSDYQNQIEQLKQQQILVMYEEMFDRAIQRAEKFASKLETINGLITDEMMFNPDTGHLTEFGALSIVLNAKQLDTGLNALKEYTKKRQQIMDDFNAGKFGQETYDKMMDEVESSIQSSLQNAQSLQQGILNIIKNQAKAEQEALFKVIDARKEALKKKKEYYDYDKSLKKQTNEIDLLKQQIAALEGLTDAQSKAEKARLEADLADKQEELDDTVRDHVYELQIDGLDEMQDQLSEDLEKWQNELASNLDKMSEAISEAVNNVGGNTADALNSIAKMLEKFGISVGDLGITQDSLDTSKLPHYRKGAKRVGKDVLAVTNDGGREIIVTKQGVITPLQSGDGVIPNQMTESIIEMVSAYQHPLNYTVPDIPKTQSNNVSININYDGPMLNVEGDMTQKTLPDLQTILVKSNQYTQNEIRKNMKRFR